jgi:hypothetical protein
MIMRDAESQGADPAVKTLIRVAHEIRHEIQYGVSLKRREVSLSELEVVELIGTAGNPVDSEG